MNSCIVPLHCYETCHVTLVLLYRNFQAFYETAAVTYVVYVEYKHQRIKKQVLFFTGRVATSAAVERPRLLSCCILGGTVVELLVGNPRPGYSLEG